jgi:hypothetical protein
MKKKMTNNNKYNYLNRSKTMPLLKIKIKLKEYPSKFQKMKNNGSFKNRKLTIINNYKALKKTIE